MTGIIENAPTFTPGPWEFHSHVSAPALGRRVGKVAEVSIAYKDSATRDANGALIAAAPDLYAKLEDCVRRLRSCATHAGNAGFAVDALCEQYETALARARGEQP